jgi:hypothetical protein
MRGGQTQSGGLAPEWGPATTILREPPQPGKGFPVADLDPTEARRQRGLAIAAVCKITQKHGQWVVPSQTGNGSYRVNLDPPSPAVPMCTCPDYEARGEPCKHVFAVRYVIERETSSEGLETVTETLTITKKTCATRKTYQGDCTNKSHGYRGLRIPGIFAGLVGCWNAGNSS